MLGLKFARANPDRVRGNIEKKFQDHKLSLVDQVIAYDQEYRGLKTKGDDLRTMRDKESREIGKFMAQGNKDQAEKIRAEVVQANQELEENRAKTLELEEKIKETMIQIPQIIDPSVPASKDDSENAEIEKFDDPGVPSYGIPYHVDIMESFSGLGLDSARKTSRSGFYYLQGDIARLHSAMMSYAQDFMIDRGFIYCVPPFIIRSDVVTGVMSFDEVEDMMYKIEGGDLYLIGTSEHSAIRHYINTIQEEDKFPLSLTSYSPCFRKKVKVHDIEKRGVYRIHQFEKQETVVICEPENSKTWFEKLWQNTVDLFKNMDIPVRILECCSGDLADPKVKSLDVGAWSSRRKRYFEVGPCSNLGDTQTRRLGIRIRGQEGDYFTHTLNNTVVAPPRMLITYLENHLQEDGSVTIPEVLRPYMGGHERLERVGK